MVTICMQCGDAGYANAYVYCVKCLIFAVHRYCLPEIPKTFDEFVDWVCDDCKEASSNGRCSESVISASMSGSVKKRNSQSSPGNNDNCVKTEPMLQSVPENPCLSGDARQSDDCFLSGVDATKDSPKESVPMERVDRSDMTRELDGVEEVEVAPDESLQRTNLEEKTEVSSSVSGKEKQRLETTTDQKISDGEHQRDGKEVADRLSKRTRSGKKYQVSSSIFQKEKQSDEKEEAEAEAVADRLSKRTRNLKEEASQQTHESRRSTHDIVWEREKECGEEGSFVVPTQRNVNGEDLQQTHGARTHMHIPTRSTVKEELSSYPIMTPPIAEPSGHSLQVKPQVEAIWRGKFHIVNKKDETFEGFVAHLSNMACQRVIEEAKLLPVLLHLEMVPTSTVWPKSFQKAPPSEEHIALYIFPADKRHEKKFNSLADYMSKENLAMRSITKNAELLIFPSTELQPMTSWRFQNKYYIWGVFKQKRLVSCDT